ncbi:uncharacterized protein DUF4157 [Flavobacterium sp. 90]|uniref:eCIS core domain-containing protein n=1 Tax=unclassified Flavobacterium TaxID=196869 RepID=UPI000EB0E0E3|nr:MULTISPECIES: DUF4157 domain-containing protein [unclassified Flavobacterium]RKR04859.1 uncharacterized protein DUF4157 [Flavobacterium sp. 81]TCK56180.1 uncharacterized protein DUF4157 [Flavobacterium sp. 90]
MTQQHEKISENKTAVTAAYNGGGTTAAQLKNNREYPVVQQKLAEKRITQQASFTPVQRKANNTGLPDNLKSGMENLSGHSMDDVKVHYNSDKPQQLNAHAYAQGSNIHIASGQEKHLPHEAWHVVQQKQGRVKPTLQMKGKVNVNDDSGLEKEADVMGNKALNIQLKKEIKQPNTLKTVNNNGSSSVRQLKSEQTTDYGKFIADPYRIIPATAPVSGANIELKFEPNEKVEGRIGLVQTVKRDLYTVDGKHATKDSDFGLMKGQVLEGENKGWRVDQLPFGETKGVLGYGKKKFLQTTSPVAYGFANYHSGHEALPEKLSDTPNPKDTLPSHGYKGNKTQTGYRKNNTIIPAILEDTPNHPKNGGSKFLAETAAIILDGPMQKTYLGSIEWGYEAAVGKSAQLLPAAINLKSMGIPSPRFMEAALAWNRVEKIKDPYNGIEHLIIPLPVQYAGFKKAKDLPSLIEIINEFLQSNHDAPDTNLVAKQLLTMAESEGLHAHNQIQTGIPQSIKKVEDVLKMPLGFLGFISGMPTAKLVFSLNQKLESLKTERERAQKYLTELEPLFVKLEPITKKTYTDKALDEKNSNSQI